LILSEVVLGVVLILSAGVVVGVLILSAGVLAVAEGSRQGWIEVYFAEKCRSRKILSPPDEVKLRFTSSEARSFDYGEYAFAQDEMRFLLTRKPVLN